MPVVIDTDPGIDDALALLFAWNSPEIQVEVITTVAGNVTIEAASTNLLRLLALRRPVPRPVVAAGAPGPLARALTTATRYHGEDGLGDLPDWPEVEPLPGSPGAVASRTERRHWSWPGHLGANRSLSPPSASLMTICTPIVSPCFGVMPRLLQGSKASSA